jgi:hypothetical protein
MAHALPAPVVPGTVAHRHLGRTLWHAYHEVPAYHALWRSAGLDPAALELPAEMERLPVITRRDLMRFPPAERCRPGLHGGLQMEHSRGTTGAPFDVPLDRDHAPAKPATLLQGAGQLWLPAGAARAVALQAQRLRPGPVRQLALCLRHA